MDKRAEGRGMNLYLDDSGDGGFKFGQGSSTHIVFAAVAFDDPTQLEVLSKEIDEIRKQYNYQGEIKFNKSSDEARCALLSAVATTDCRILAISADKRYIYQPKLRSEPAALKAFLIRMLLSNHFGCISNAKVFIDGKDTKGFSTEKSDVDYFMRMCNKKYPDTARAIRFVDSKRELGIQIADLVAGSLRRQLDEDDSKFFDLVRSKTFHSSNGNHWEFTRREVKKAKSDGSYVHPTKIKSGSTT
ncbi:hypothetical protein CIP107518_01935 [Corynebacterium diphtheriae]|nr:hypothetical protein CIP107518_01935 [Corynebacterium diphtheriae]